MSEQQKQTVRLDVVKSEKGLQVHRQGYATPDLQGVPVDSLQAAVEYAGEKFGLQHEVLMRYWPGDVPGHGDWFRLQLQCGKGGALRWFALRDRDAR